MDRPDTAAGARSACRDKYGMDITFAIRTGGRHVTYRMTGRNGLVTHAHEDRRYIVTGPHHASTTSRAFRNMSEDQRIALVVESVGRDLERNRDHYTQIADALVSIPEARRSLQGLKVKVTWSAGGAAQIKATWRGVGNDLSEGRQIHHIEHELNQGAEVLAKKLMSLATRDRRLRLLAANTGVTLDAPLEAFLRSVGRTPGEFIDAARAHGFCKPRESRHDPAPAPMEFSGRAISATFTDGLVSSRFQLGEGVSWSKGCITARDLVLPDSVVSSIRGRPLREVVDHPWLEGLVASSAVQTAGRSGHCVTIMTRRAA